MVAAGDRPPLWAARNIRLYYAHRFLTGVLFWQAMWFLFFQQVLTPAQAILLYALNDLVAMAFEVPSGYLSDRLGRRRTLLAAALCLTLGAALHIGGSSFAILALAQLPIGAAFALVSGTDSALLYESLKAAGRDDDVERAELIGWRFGFAALALSALAGGVLSLWSLRLPYVAQVVVGLVTCLVVLRMVEPPHDRHGAPAPWGALRDSLRHPVLLWLLALASAMYLFSHVPFVFGQPFIADMLDRSAVDAPAPLVSGVVTTVMMLLSVAVSFGAPTVRRTLGLPGVLLLAFGMQIALIAGLTLGGSVWVIGLLMLRMVPNSLSQPFILARIQRELPDHIRATYLSLQTFIGRIVFALTLAGGAALAGELPLETLRQILGAYALAGLAVWGLLAWTARRARVGAS